MSKFVVIEGWREVVQRTIEVVKLDDDDCIIEKEILDATEIEITSSGENKRLELSDFALKSRNFYIKEIQDFINKNKDYYEIPN